jgi:hypothetical protein
MPYSTLSKLLNAYNNIKDSSQTVIVRGESGIGKSFYSKKFIELVNEDIYLINVTGLFIEQNAYSTINSAVYKHISEKIVNKEIAFDLIQKIAAGIPRFGQYMSYLFDTNKQHNALLNLVKKSGINPNEPNIYNIVSFFENLAKGKTIVLYCDNIQWFDKDSWKLIISLISSIPESHWFCIINYTTNAEVTQLSHYDFSSYIHQLQSNPNIEVIEIERVIENNLDNFCQDILGLPIRLSREQFHIIYEYSKGVPYYIKTILQLLKDGNYIILSKDKWEWISLGDWKSEQIREMLKDCIEERIKAIYRKIPGSRDMLELASVFGEEFQEDPVNDIFETKDSFNLLSSIEAKFRLIQYLVDDRSWIFEHSLTHNYIYNSIGSKAKDLHLKIAKYLQNTASPNFMKISLHFQQAGEQEEATIYKLKEAEQLLTSGCYDAASELIDKISEDWLALFSLSNSKKLELEVLKGKAKFHTIQYESALEIFTSILSNVNTDIERALCHRWLGRTYSKLNSQLDFLNGLNHLEIAKRYYEDLEKYEELGFVYADLVVVYAHLNRIKDAETSFKKAEHYFNNTKNTLGMLRLQRRTVIFMEAKFSANLLEKTGMILKNMNLPNEQIMTFNNAATQFIYSGNLQRAKSLLLEALSSSINLGGFGQVYLYNNLGMISYIENELDEASYYFDCGRNGKYRHVEQLIIDINESAVLAKKISADSMTTIFNRIYRKALEVGENDYIVPAGLNLAKSIGKEGNWIDAKDLLDEIKEKVNILNSDYERYIWNSIMKECTDRLASNNNLITSNKELHIQTEYFDLNNPIYQSDYSLVPMQFWSDN